MSVTRLFLSGLEWEKRLNFALTKVFETEDFWKHNTFTSKITFNSGKIAFLYINVVYFYFHVVIALSLFTVKCCRIIIWKMNFMICILIKLFFVWYKGRIVLGSIVGMSRDPRRERPPYVRLVHGERTRALAFLGRQRRWPLLRRDHGRSARGNFRPLWW